MRVVVIGGGASGTLTAAQLARQAALTRTRVEVLVVDPGRPGQGVAYSTTDHRHRLNVPAKNMTAFPDDPGHFLRWLHANHDADFPEGGFAPRPVFGRYLADVLDTSFSAPWTRCTQLRARVVDLRPARPYGVVVTLDSGSEIDADAAVLAVGHGATAPTWAPDALRSSTRFVADPWTPGALPALPDSASILLVGTGLTMVDIAMTYGNADVHCISRHGMLPLPHARTPRPPATAPAVPVEGETLTARAARRLVFDRIREFDGDWRAAIDSLRPVTSTLWNAFDDASRSSFMEVARRRWDRVRHRMDPELGDFLAQRQAAGKLHLHAATVRSATEHDGVLDVTLTDGTTVRPDLVVNCTGAPAATGAGADPLVRRLLERRSALLGPLGLGFATDGRGRLFSADGLAAWTLGPLRQGELWESTAVPEIRRQAEDVAAAVLASFAVDVREVA